MKNKESMEELWKIPSNKKDEYKVLAFVLIPLALFFGFSLWENAISNHSIQQVQGDIDCTTKLFKTLPVNTIDNGQQEHQQVEQDQQICNSMYPTTKQDWDTYDAWQEQQEKEAAGIYP